MAMAFATLSNDFTAKYVKCGKQSAGSVAFIVMRLSAASAFNNRQ